MTGDPWREAWAAVHGLYAERTIDFDAHALTDSGPTIRQDAYFVEARDLVAAGRITFDVGGLMGWDIGVDKAVGFEPRASLERTTPLLTPDQVRDAPPFDYDLAVRELKQIMREDLGFAALVAARILIAAGRARALQLYKAGERPKRRLVLIDDPPGVKPE